MRIIAVIALLWAGAAMAQPPQEVTPEFTISIGLGQTRVYRFDEPFDRINVISKGIVTATAQTDHQLSLVGDAVGETYIYVYGPSGTLMEAALMVTPEKGHVVKMYGTGRNEDVNAGFVMTYCNEFGCGRPDKDLPVPAVTVERFQRTKTKNEF